MQFSGSGFVPKSRIGLALAVLAVLGYAALIYGFAAIDFYHQHFFARGLSVTFYSFSWLAFAAFLAWIVYAAGVGVITGICGRRALWSLPAFERYPLAFLAGAGVWHGVLFVIGLAGWDNRTVAATMTLAVMALSVPHLAVCLREFGHAALRPVAWQKRAVQLAVAAIAVAFVLVKGLYPGGGHDYYTHYFYFYLKVVETGWIGPNEVWYHFFYSKGAGLYFLAMLLTDPLAPQLVTLTFVACGAAITFAFLQRWAPTPLLPWVGVGLYLVLLIYTPGPAEFKAHGGWGDMEKIHELTAVLIFGVIWIASRIFASDVPQKRPWQVALFFCVAAIGVLTPLLLLLIGLLFTIVAAYFLMRRAWRAAILPLAVAGLAGICLLLMFAINYALTGIAVDQLLLPLWRWVDLQKVADWGVMFELLMLHRGLTALAAASTPLSQTFPLLINFLRLDLWWPIVVAAVPFFVWSLRSSEARKRLRARVDPAAWGVLSAFVVSVVLMALVAGRSQPVSFYRMSTFCYGPILCLALLFWHSVTTGDLNLGRLGICIVGVGAVVTVFSARILERAETSAVIGTALRFAQGQYSLLDAYQNQRAWPGRMPWGGIYPGMIEPWKLVGYRTPIWSLHVHSYCMLPDCIVRTFASFRFSRAWQTVYFRTPEAARAALQAEGQNFFFFSKELSVRDPLPASPLFAPDNIAKYLAVRWTDGTSFLLTWPGPHTQPITEDFLAAYRKGVAENGAPIQTEDWRKISDYIDINRDHLQPFALPWCVTCDGVPRMDTHGAGALP